MAGGTQSSAAAAIHGRARPGVGGLNAIAPAVLALAVLAPAAAWAQATIVSSTGYTVTFNGNQQAFFSNTWDGTSQQSPSNIALSSQGSTAFASSQYGSPHLTVNANDGVYGNTRSWLAALTGTQASVGIAFPVAQSLTSIAWGRDNGRNSTAIASGGGGDTTVGGTNGQLSDRSTGTYTLQFTTVANPGAATPSGDWTTLGTVTLATGGSFSPWFRHEYDVRTSAGQPISGVTGFRIINTWTNQNDAQIIDEIEAYRTVYWTGGSAAWAASNGWQTASTSGTTTTPFTGDSLAFAQATSATQAVTLGAADRTARALSFLTADAVTLSAGGTDRTLTLGWVGDLTTSTTAVIPTLAVGGSAGAVTIGGPTAGQQVALALNASQVWTNDAANPLIIHNTVSRIASDTTSRILTVGGSGNTTIGGGVADGGAAGTLAFAKSGSGMLTLSGSNTFSGGSTVSAGTLLLASAAAQPATGLVTVANGATLGLAVGTGYSLNDFLTLMTGSLANVSMGATANAGIDTTAGPQTIADNLGGTRGLAKLGGGMLTLTGSNSYTGPTLVSGGTLAIGNGGAVGWVAGNVVNNAVLVLNRADTIAFPGSLSGTGSVVQAGPGTVLFSGSNGLAGVVAINAGTATIRGPTALGTSLASVNTGGRLAVNVSSGQQVSNDLTLGGGTLASVVIATPTGGSFSTTPDGLYGLNTFTTTGTSTFSGYDGAVDVLLVGGGGGGGTAHGGGGGGGGFLETTGTAAFAGNAIVVGAGGAGGLSGASGSMRTGSNGGGSTAFGAAVLGGGGGGAYLGPVVPPGNGSAGASGGGGGGSQAASTGGSGTSPQGFGGGNGATNGTAGGGGGGGGAFAAGNNASGANGGRGGAGRTSSITGSSVAYAGGGGGGGWYSSGTSAAGGVGGGGAGGNGSNVRGVNGTNGLGGGGGGGSDFTPGGGDGGSGVVIVRYLLTNPLVQTLSGSVTVNATSTLDAVRGTGGLRLTGGIGGTGGLTIASTGTGTASMVIFDGVGKSYAGATFIAAGGDLRVNSDNALATGPVTVNGRLGGSGSLGGAVTINAGGVLAPGNSIESLTTAALSFANGSTYAYEIDSSVPLSVGADFTKALGNLWLSGTVGLSLANLAASPTGFAAGTTFSLVNYTGSWNGGLFSVGGSPVGNGSTFSFGANTWRLDYAAPTGGSNFTGDQTSGSFVNMVVVPEPAALALAALGIACAAAARRRRSR